MNESERERDCIFCDIVAGDKPAHVVHRDEWCLAFMDIYPATRGHVLVIPRAHHRSVFEIDDEAMRAVASATRRVARAIRDEIQPDGLSVVQANGAAAGQTVMHYHLHLLPRAEGQRLRLHGPRQGDPDELAATARALAARL